MLSLILRNNYAESLRLIKVTIALLGFSFENMYYNELFCGAAREETLFPSYNFKANALKKACIKETLCIISRGIIFALW